MTRLSRYFLQSSLLMLAALFFVTSARAGGPRYVAGASYFDPAVKGMPLTWHQGPILYYTDQGSLSPILPQAMADAYVADAFSRWTSVQTAALLSQQAGQLSQDVNGTNVTRDSLGNLQLPADIQPTAIGKPIAIVYDADGAVTDALLGAGASAPSLCFTNTVFGGIDAFSTDGHLAHALVVINGNCAQTASQLPDFQYRLIRVLGSVLGLDWSQLNLNVITGNPSPSGQDFAGFPLMHAADPISCVPISICYPTADQPKLDDRAALSRMYPVTPQNQGSYPGKLPFAESSGRIHGSVYFVDANGNPLQPMQGVNVVARWLDPVSHQPSKQYAISSVSGFPFRGNAGNTITGFNDPHGLRLDRFGSDDPAWEGFFDLAGLVFPDGNDTTQYQLTVESIDPIWSESLQPYGPWQVKPSGTAQPIVVTVARGGDVQQDVLMTGSANQLTDIREPESFTSPAKMPAGGDWIGTLSSYGDADYFSFSGRVNRTLSIQVTALDETGAPSQDKARPVIGVWALSSPPGTLPGVATPTAFNSGTFAVSALQGAWAARLNLTTDFRLGIADERGDGRPDYAYHAHVLYADTVIPSRLSVSGGTILGIKGLGFRSGTTVSIGGVSVPVLSTTASQIVVQAPSFLDSTQDITLADSTGASSIMTGALTYGAGPNDSIVLLLGSNPQVVAGSESPNPVRIRVVGPDGVTGVAGASVNFIATPSAALTSCGNVSSCTLLTDEQGEASTRVRPPTAGVYTITATLAPASYLNPKYVQATVSAQSSALDIAIIAPYRWLARGSTADVPITARVVSYGAPLAGRTVNYQIMAGAATLTASASATDANGYASTNARLNSLAGDLQISACVAPANAPCSTLYGHSVPLTSLKMQAIAGSAQLVAVGQTFQPVLVRITDSTSPPNPVQGATVDFSYVVIRPDNDVFDQNDNDRGMPVILASGQASIASDVSGFASVTPTSAGVPGPVEIEVLAVAGTSATQSFEAESAWMPTTAMQTHVQLDPLDKNRPATTRGRSRPLLRPENSEP
ncbi:MAG TPA: IPT/TIG domain-containing protein [Terriglobales bacterium]|nr:IPT/TIG domain-containing protein [Terriglobales bacterium]